ncbi:MAG TPA: sensor histidine kinase [Terriglobales bacterium]|nr:sensor histidine kinase [Terriglobales bacterium]
MTRRWSRDDAVDWALAIAVTVGAELQRAGCDCNNDPRWLDVLVTLLATLPIGLRRRRPFPVLLVVGAASIAHIAFGFNNPFLITFAVLVALFSVANHAQWGLSVFAAFATAIVLPVSFALDWHNQGRVNLSDLPYNYALFGAAWILGDNLRRQREQAQLAMRLTAAEEERSKRALADERVRIARELHDVVAHTLSVIVLQAGAGRRIAPRQPERAAAVLGGIESLGREALGDMRRLVGMLRTGPEREHEPQPSLERLPELADRVRSAGLHVDLRTEGQPRSLPPGVDLSAYRIVQEALTNTLRHAGAGRAEVVVRYCDTGVEVEVTDDGRGPSVNGATGGHGLAGMRERVGMFGGELQVGARNGGGFRVRAMLPA